MSTSPLKPVRPLQVRKQDFVRNEIWNAATDLFASKGFDGTTVDEIAEAANVSRRTFFRYFSSKEDLLVQSISNYQQVLTEAIREFSHVHPPLEMLRQIVSRVAGRVVAAPTTKKAMQITRDNPSARGAQLARLWEIEDQIASEFVRSAKRFSRSEFTPKLMASLTLSTLGITFKAWLERDSADVDVLIDQVFSSLTKICQSGMA